ncbi:hypothetical protein COE98_15825 [Bacillus wiedmannii]|uniref:DUF3942 family protein n=1 Tax=Bacillus wiedmannii TaxID=1890302 RepID=UPI000BFB31B9|nr:DUF3942 family protein [Bacillus wiedmannii]PHB90641.1 hypothetical protein COE98_15825 [Bacillus wiedmannii]
MSKLDQTISKLSAYVGEDREEEVLMEHFDKLTPTFEKIRKQFPKISEKECLVINQREQKYIIIESSRLRLSINKQRNVIDVEKHKGIDVTKLDEIKVQDNELYCVGRGEKFTEDILNDYLSETFVEILG